MVDVGNYFLVLGDMNRKGKIQSFKTTRYEMVFQHYIRYVKGSLSILRDMMLRCAKEKLRTMGKRRGGFLDFSERGKISGMLYRKAERDLAQGLIAKKLIDSK